MALDIKDIFTRGAEKLVTSIGDAFDKNFTSKEEKETIKLEIQKELNRHLETMANDATHQLELILSDRQDAREMFKVNSQLQKIYAAVFLSAYVLLSALMIGMIWHIALSDIHIPEWGIGFVSTIWGAMSTKVGTVTDFLFGSSMAPDRK